MNYAKNILELDKVLEILQKYCQTNNGKENIKNLEISNQLAEVDQRLNEAEALRKIILAIDQIPFGGIFDIQKILRKANLSSVLTTTEISDVRNFIYSCKNILEFRKEIISKKIDFTILENYFSQITYCKVLLEKIDRVIDEKGIIYDHATPELNAIRKNLKKEELHLRNKLTEIITTKSAFLTDSLIVSRNNHLCVCVKNEFKNSFKGIIMDYSQSGQTVYMEPMACAEIQAKMSNLQQDEKQEELKILKILTSDVAVYADELQLSFDQIIHLDVISAKALYAIQYDCYKPFINQTQTIKLIDAKHPLIDSKKVVPISIDLGQKYKGIIITGPNTGGKTVALKTVGLLTLMTQCGILIPAHPESQINVFDAVFADIGDEQSIEQSLSTFSSHMTRIIQIIDQIGLNSLVLLDELGSGTDPKEGSGLAIAIIEYLLDRDARMLITSHYSELKEFAYNERGLLNACVEFDLKTLQPTYRLLLGTPGKSNALEIAKRLGLNQKIVSRALEQVKINDDNVTILMDKLETKGYELNELINNYQKKLSHEEEMVAAYEKKLDDLRVQEEIIFKKAKEKANDYLEEVRENAQSLILEIEEAKKSGSTPEIADIKYRVSNLGENIIQSNIEDQEIEVGDIVLIKAYQQEGQVLQIIKNKYRVQMSQMILDFKKEELKFLRKKEKVKREIKKVFHGSVTSNVNRQAKMELDLRGVRYEEVQMLMDKFIDDAILANLSQISIIHGYGTGAIRKAVQDYIKKNSAIKSSRFGREGEGLMGVTVCTLK